MYVFVKMLPSLVVMGMTGLLESDVPLASVSK